jgi:dipeptidyl aminopeptidase/acylaminoacyl peptidase
MENRTVTGMWLPALCLCLFAALAVPAQPVDVLTPHKVAAIRSVTSARMSPDGTRIAYTLSVPRKPLVDDDGESWVELHVVDVASGQSRPYVTGKANVSVVRWTPDGRSLAFLQKRVDDKFTSLYVIALDGGEARLAEALEESISSYDLHPDGKRVVVVATEPEDPERKKLRDKGFAQEIYEEDVRAAKPWVGNLFDEAKPAKLAVEGHVSGVYWSPVDDRIALAVAPSPLVDDDYVRKRVRIVDLQGKTLAQVENPGKLGEIRWSPDGKRVALIAAGGIHDPSDARLMLAPSTGGAPAEVLPGIEGDAAACAWQSVDWIVCVMNRGVQVSLDRISPAGESTALVATGGPILTSISLSADGLRGAFVANSPTHPPEVYAMAQGESAPRRLTDSNPWLAGIRLAPQEVVRFKARDGLELEGVLVRPLDEKKGQRYPLILYVHGGPESHHSNGWLTNYGDPAQTAAARGFAVMHTNYRGSTGRGTAFARLSQADAAGKEFDDLIDAVDHLIEIGLVDKERVAVTGGSYGGYATAWLSTRYSDRIAAGVMFVGISNVISKVGTTDIPDEEFHVHALHRPWEDWMEMLERSPIYHAGQSQTPLLILHGKDDPRVHPGQSRELYRHLKLRSKAPVRLVLYPGEGHGNRKAAARLDYNLRMQQWIEHYLMGSGGAPPAMELDYAEAKVPATPQTSSAPELP